MAGWRQSGQTLAGSAVKEGLFGDKLALAGLLECVKHQNHLAHAISGAELLNLQLVFVLRHARKNVDQFLQNLVALATICSRTSGGDRYSVAQVGAAEALSSFEPLANSHNNRSCRGCSASKLPPGQEPFQ